MQLLCLVNEENSFNLCWSHTGYLHFAIWAAFGLFEIHSFPLNILTWLCSLLHVVPYLDRKLWGVHPGREQHHPHWKHHPRTIWVNGPDCHWEWQRVPMNESVQKLNHMFSLMYSRNPSNVSWIHRPIMWFIFLQFSHYKQVWHCPWSVTSNGQDVVIQKGQDAMSKPRSDVVIFWPKSFIMLPFQSTAGSYMVETRFWWKIGWSCSSNDAISLWFGLTRWFSP